MKKAMTLFLTLVLIFGMYQISPYNRNESDPVKLVYPQVSDIQDIRILQGTVVDPAPVYLYPEGPSVLLETLVAVGDSVQAGQPVMRLKQTNVEQNGEVLAASALMMLEDAIKAGEYDQVKRMFNGIKQEQDWTYSGKVYELYSPVDGMIMELSAVENETLNGFFPCVEICDLSKLIVRAEVDESIIGDLKKDMFCEVTVPALGGEKTHGTITSVMPYAKQTGLFSVNPATTTTIEIGLSQPNQLRPGYRSEVRVTTAYRSEMLLIPYETISQDEAGQEYVIKLENNRTVKQIIITGSELDSQVEVLDGLEVDDLILYHSNLITEGMEVWYE